MAFLPGALLLRVLKLRLGPVGTPVACLAFSGLANYLFVLVATACGVFNHTAALLFVGAELAFAAWLLRNSWRELFASDLLQRASVTAGKAWNGLSAFIEESKAPKALSLAALAAAFAAVGIALLHIADSAGTIFDAWDAVLSWNRWATGWLAGSYPEWTNGYPQLVPTNWALCYMIQGDNLQFVPKLCVGLYELGLILAMADIALLLRSTGLMAAAPLLSWLLRNVEIGRFGGDVDLAVTFMAFSAFHLLVRCSKAETPESFKRLLLAASLLAAATAATKQAGLFLFVMIVPLAWILLREPLRKFGFDMNFRIRAILIHLGLAILIAAPCYICAKYMVMQGRDKYKVKFVIEDIYGGRGYVERAIISSKMFLLRLELGNHDIPGARWTHVKMDQGLSGFVEFFKPYRALTACVATLTILLLALGARSGPLGLWPLLLLAAPFTLIWALMYCYDLRNLSSALPFLALSLGLGLERLLSKAALWRGWLLAALALIGLTYLATSIFTAENLQKNHETLEMRIGEPRLNAKIYEYHEKNPIKSRIATDYEFVHYLPGMKGSLRYQEFSGQTKKEEGLYFEALHDPTVGFMLVPNYTMPSVKEDIRKRIESGEMERIFHEFSYMLIKINRKPADKPAAPDESPAK